MNTMLTLIGPAQARAFRAAGHWGDTSIYAHVAAHAARTPDAPAIRDRWQRTTYRDLIGAADRLAGGLAAHGLRRGSRVAVWLPSRIETAVAVLACSRNGYVCCPSLHRDHTVADILGLLGRMGASALVAEARYGADGEHVDLFAALDRVAPLRVTYRLEPAAGARAPWLAMEPEAAAPRGDDPDEIVYLAFTSGTTGQPKGVMHSDNTLLANALAMAKDWNIGRHSVVYSLSPLSHNLGFGGLVMTLVSGGEFVIHDLPRGHSLIDRMVETAAAFALGVPTHAIDLLSEMRGRGLKTLGALKGFRVSGASVPPSVAAGLIEHGVTPQGGFGMTEAGSHNYTLPSDGPGRICETSGRACASYEVRIFSSKDPDVEVPAGTIGQIGGRGASLMLGYFDDQAATEASFNAAGWFMTGDLGMLDAEGYLRVTGRKKDIIIRGGHNIYPARIEALALRHHAIDRAAVVPVADARLGEKVCLAVSPRVGREIDPQDMLLHLDRCGLSKFDMPEYFVCLDALPLTASGKILKRDLVARIETGTIAPVPVRFSMRSASREGEKAV